MASLKQKGKIRWELERRFGSILLASFIGREAVMNVLTY